MNPQLSVVELFSGIGSQARALRNIGANIKIVATCEWDIHAIVAYDLIHNRTDKIEPEYQKMDSDQLFETLSALTISSEGKRPMDRNTLHALSDESKRRILSSIKRTKNKVNIQDVKGDDLPSRIDIMTYSFPCQDLSNVGALHGYNKGIARDAGNRSCMLWEVERLLKERHASGLYLPKFLLMENVPTLLSDRHKKNFDEWISVLENLGYHSKYFRLNATQFGCPQNRYRMLMISTFVGGRTDIKKKLDDFYDHHNLEDAEFRETLEIKKTSLNSCLHTDYTNPIYREEALSCQPNATPSRQKIWDDNLKIIGENNALLTDHVATITTKQDRHPNSGNIFFDPQNGKSKYRFLTPRECIQIMGFNEEDYEILVDKDCHPNPKYTLFTRDKIHRLAGNSIPVKILEAVFSLIVEIRKQQIARTYIKKECPQAADCRLLLGENSPNPLPCDHCAISRKDRLTPEQRSRNMSHIHGRDTAPEIAVRSFLFSKGLRFRTCDRSLPGSPDIVLKKYKTVIEVRGCFWHRHTNCKYATTPATNNDFWTKKFQQNVARDQQNDLALKKQGWRLIVIWECEIKNGNYIKLLTKLLDLPSDHTIQTSKSKV